MQIDRLPWHDIIKETLTELETQASERGVDHQTVKTEFDADFIIGIVQTVIAPYHPGANLGFVRTQLSRIIQGNPPGTPPPKKGKIAKALWVAERIKDALAQKLENDVDPSWKALGADFRLAEYLKIDPKRATHLSATHFAEDLTATSLKIESTPPRIDVNSREAAIKRAIKERDSHRNQIEVKEAAEAFGTDNLANILKIFEAQFGKYIATNPKLAAYFFELKEKLVYMDVQPFVFATQIETLVYGDGLSLNEREWLNHSAAKKLDPLDRTILLIYTHLMRATRSGEMQAEDYPEVITQSIRFMGIIRQQLGRPFLTPSNLSNLGELSKFKLREFTERPVHQNYIALEDKLGLSISENFVAWLQDAIGDKEGLGPIITELLEQVKDGIPAGALFNYVKRTTALQRKTLPHQLERFFKDYFPKQSALEEIALYLSLHDDRISQFSFVTDSEDIVRHAQSYATRLKNTLPRYQENPKSQPQVAVESLPIAVGANNRISPAQNKPSQPRTIYRAPNSHPINIRTGSHRLERIRRDQQPRSIFNPTHLKLVHTFPRLSLPPTQSPRPPSSALMNLALSGFTFMGR